MASAKFIWGVLSLVIFVLAMTLAVSFCWWNDRRRKRKVKAVKQNLAIQQATLAAREELEKTNSGGAARGRAEQTTSSQHGFELPDEIEKAQWK
ncbi:hypothetical protein K491DRAFT_691218 [Lophiostoma macrostomum CBS 122681]|uniref:Uncharacterized protein n=1 Tax=Lophiostoma macrostomum CBS 122681 TaxID=1314788 RepID=A0A6A6TEY6_9PLEO|nr:hypothetical protein K491DRAFT_691218 [Lophiostoma macrostomum CBS 122681]